MEPYHVGPYQQDLMHLSILFQTIAAISVVDLSQTRISYKVGPYQHDLMHLSVLFQIIAAISVVDLSLTRVCYKVVVK